MVRFDSLSCFSTRLNHVSIECALCQEVEVAEFSTLFIEAVNKLVTNDFTFTFWIRHTCQFTQETVACIDAHYVDTKQIFTHIHHLVALVFTKHTMVDEHTCELVANSFVDKHCHYCRVDTTTQSTQHFAVAHLFADFSNLHIDIALHCPILLCFTHFEHEVSNNICAIYRTAHFWVELHEVCFQFWIINSSCKSVITLSCHAEVFRMTSYVVAVRHPHVLCFWKSIKQKAVVFYVNRHFTILFCSTFFDYTAIEFTCQLHTIADTEDRQSHRENLWVAIECVCFVYRLWSATEDDTFHAWYCANLLSCEVVRTQLTEHAHLTDTACNKLVVLRTKVEH